MKVYVVMGGCYTDYHIVKIFLGEENANRFAKDYEKKNPCEDVYVDEYNVEK